MVDWPLDGFGGGRRRTDMAIGGAAPSAAPSAVAADGTWRPFAGCCVLPWVGP